jgi:hypothetical protein
MLNTIRLVWEWIKWIVAALVPFKRGRGLTTGMRWFLWIVLDLLFLGLLYFINSVAEIAPIVQRMPFQAPWLRHFFLPILGQLVIFLVVVLYWFYHLWFAEPDDSPFPDIDAAWQEAMQALTQAGIQLPRVPLFLVVGRPTAPEEHLFEASGMKLMVRQAPAHPNAPVHVFASNDAVYVTCRGASVLSKLAEILTLEGESERYGGQDEEGEQGLDQTLRPGGKEQAVIELLRSSMGGQEITPSRKRALRRAAIMKPIGSDFLSDPKEVARCKARLAHLCRLIVRDRQPFCGANGILLLVPVAATDTTGEAQFAAQAAQEDLNAVRRELKLDCPLVSLLVDMEQLPGFPEFMQRQPPKELGNRRGSGFPMATRLPRDEVLEHVRASLGWVCTTYLQDSVYRIFQGESPQGEDPATLFPGNARLVLLLDEMNERAASLELIVHNAIAPENEPLFRYSGCYMAATGGRGSQAFVAGVFQKLVKEQSGVSWTDAALAEDAECRTWATYYLILAFALLVSLVVLLGLIFFK